jgi:uncharacterized damage-inducible protein DinB
MPSLESTVNKLQKSRAGLLETAGAVPNDLWRECPAPGVWSAAEVIAHLGIVERTIITRIGRIIENPAKAVPLVRRVHVPMRLVRYRLRRVKSPLPLDPALICEREPMLAELDAVRRATLAFVQETAARDLRPYRWPHPFLGSLNVYQWFSFISNHEMRHARQIQEIVQSFRK